MMDKRIEDKEITFRCQPATPHNSAIGVNDYASVLGQIPNGVLDFQRIGDKIMPKYLRVTGKVGIDVSSMTLNAPIEVRVIAFTQQGLTDYSNTGSLADPSDLLRGPGGTLVPYDGTIGNHLLPINKVGFRKYFDKKFKLNIIDAQTTGQGVATTSSSASFSFKIKCPKYLKFDAGVNWPNNFAPYLAVGFCYLDQATPAVVVTPVVCDAVASLVFEDA